MKIHHGTRGKIQEIPQRKWKSPKTIESYIGDIAEFVHYFQSIGAIYNGVSTAVNRGSLNNIGKSMLKGAIDGAADGFMTGGISAGAMQLFRALLVKQDMDIR